MKEGTEDLQETGGEEGVGSKYIIYQPTPGSGKTSITKLITLCLHQQSPCFQNLNHITIDIVHIPQNKILLCAFMPSPF